VTLRDYFEARLLAIEKATLLSTQTEFAAKAISKSEGEEIRRRLDNTVSCAEHTILLRDIEIIKTDIRSLSEFRAELKGKASTQSVMIAYVISGIGIMFSVISLVEKIVK